MSCVGQIWVRRASFWVFVLVVGLLLVSSSLTWGTIFHPRYQVFCQVGGGFVFFRFGLVLARVGRLWVKNGSKMGQGSREKWD